MTLLFLITYTVTKEDILLLGAFAVNLLFPLLLLRNNDVWAVTNLSFK